MKESSDNLIQDLESLGLYRTYRMSPVGKKLGRFPFDKMSPGEEVRSEVISRRDLVDLGTALSKLGLFINDVYDSGVVAERKLDLRGWKKNYRYHLHPSGVWKGGYSMGDSSGINRILMITMNPDEFLSAVVWDINEDLKHLQNMGDKPFSWLDLYN